MPSTNWTETTAPDEAARFERLAARLTQVQQRHAPAERALHAKTHGGLRARVIVPHDLPAHLRQGMFARPGEYAAYVRFSNGSSRPHADQKPDVRGFAIKVLGVDGSKVLQPARTQDFLLIDSARIPFRTPDEFVGFATAVSRGAGALVALFREFGLLGAIGLLWRVLRGLQPRPVDVADLTYYGPAPIAFGPYAARLSARPLHPRSKESRPGRSPDYLGERLGARVRTSGLAFELRVQLYEGAHTPIEDSTVAWSSPYERVAVLHIDAQDPGEELARFVARLAFDPFHALVAHRPLGAIMRARKAAYFSSTANRGARADEPDGSEWQRFEGPSAKEVSV